MTDPWAEFSLVALPCGIPGPHGPHGYAVDNFASDHCEGTDHEA